MSSSFQGPCKKKLRDINCHRCKVSILEIRSENWFRLTNLESRSEGYNKVRPSAPTPGSLALAFSFSCSLAFVFFGAMHRHCPVQAAATLGGGKCLLLTVMPPTGQEMLQGLMFWKEKGWAWVWARHIAAARCWAKPSGPKQHSLLLLSPSPALSGRRGFTEPTLGNQKRPLTAWLYSQRGFNSWQILILFLICEVSHKKAVTSSVAAPPHWCPFSSFPGHAA